MRLYGLMITKDDEAIFGDWCRDQLPLYDGVVCLDGSETALTAILAACFPDRMTYLHERDLDIPHKTDHGLRAAAHRELVRRFGAGGWVMCCHADEFCYHDPRKAAALAERGGFDLVSWYSPQFYPHPDERADWLRRATRPVPERVRHYHWDYRGGGLPWREDRLYRCGPHVRWDGVTQGSVRPLGVRRPAPFHPILRHYKVYTADSREYEVAGGCSHHRRHWVGQAHRTGVAFPVRSPGDLFVASVPAYERCDRFEGSFPHPWNMGDAFCPDGADDRLQAGDPTAARPNTRPPPSRRPSDADGPSSGHPSAALRDSTMGPTTSSVGGIDDYPAPRLTARGPVDRAIIEEVWGRDAYGVRRLDEPPATVVDVGAHIGAFALLAATAWPDARVIACEADPENAALLRRHVAGRAGVAVVEAAIEGDGVAAIEFRMVADKVGGNSGGGSCRRAEPGTVSVRVAALSIVALLRSRCPGGCDLLKLDCEGSELPTLRALREAGLLASVGTIVGEWHASEGDPSSTGRVRRELLAILEATHAVAFGPEGPGREGYFTARPRIGDRARGHGPPEEVGS